MRESLHRYINNIIQLSREEIVILEEILISKKIKKNELIAENGKVCQKAWFTSEGYFRFYHIDLKGNEITSDFYFAPSFITSYTSFITGTPSFVYVQAMSDMEVLEFSKTDLFNLYDKYPKFERLGRIFAEAVAIISEEHLFLLLNQTAEFSSNFEDGNTDPEIGLSPLLENSSGSITVVTNPHPDANNSSNNVLRVATSPNNVGRAEYTAGRYETNEKKYIYTWKRYHAPDMLTDVTLGWCLINQWKTWPCPIDENDPLCDNICYPGGGIFNDIRFDESDEIRYLSRAKPDCNTDYSTLPKGSWNKFVLEIYWTNTSNGYYRIWRNDTLFGYGDNIKTLFDGFVDGGSCDIYWSNGVYSYWTKTGGETQDELTAYLDDIAIYDIDSGYRIDDICPDCEEVPGDSSDIVTYVKVNYHANKLYIFPNPVHNNLFVKGETVPSNITIYSIDGRKVKYAENTNIVNISDLKKGIYIVLINMQKSFTTIKIIKE